MAEGGAKPEGFIKGVISRIFGGSAEGSTGVSLGGAGQEGPVVDLPGFEPGTVRFDSNLHMGHEGSKGEEFLGPAAEWNVDGDTVVVITKDGVTRAYGDRTLEQLTPEEKTQIEAIRSEL